MPEKYFDINVKRMDNEEATAHQILTSD